MFALSEKEQKIIKNNRGLVHVITGNGKGKTTASLGLAMRALGHNMSVYMIQFLKSGDTGELFTVKKYLPNMRIIQFGEEAIKEKQLKIYEFSKDFDEIPKISGKFKFLKDEEEREACQQALVHSKKILQAGYDIVILDEINYAIAKKLIDVNEVINALQTKDPKTEVILTGRGATEEIIDVADYVSVINERKHPWRKGIDARKGIEY